MHKNPISGIEAGEDRGEYFGRHGNLGGERGIGTLA
jgi:hypothetical protein